MSTPGRPASDSPPGHSGQAAHAGPEEGSAAAAPGPPAAVAPVRADLGRILLAGVAVWCIALVVVLAVPSLHSGQRSWWPWTCVVGIVGGLLALAYVRRGRGNAAQV